MGNPRTSDDITKRGRNGEMVEKQGTILLIVNKVVEPCGEALCRWHVLKYGVVENQIRVEGAA